jgi:hypothetical protein
MFNEFDDHNNDEVAMAKADLYKAAKYSIKLFKMMEEGQNLEAWVQAKITKAADYIASVYHSMDYEKGKSEYGEHLDNAELYSESLKEIYTKKLMEAKVKLEKKKMEKPCSESTEQLDETIYDRIVNHPKFGKLEKIRFNDEYIIVQLFGPRDFKVLNAPGDVQQRWEQYKKEAEQGSKKRSHNVINDNKITEKAKPSSGLSAKQRSSIVKKAKAGEDFGKPGKGFEKVEKAAKKSGAKDPKAVAGKVFWKQQAKK